MKSKTTPWYSGDVNPVRRGVYERKYTTGKAIINRYCYWTGEFWCLGGHTPFEAVQLSFFYGAAVRQKLPWRGLIKE